MERLNNIVNQNLFGYKFEWTDDVGLWRRKHWISFKCWCGAMNANVSALLCWLLHLEILSSRRIRRCGYTIADKNRYSVLTPWKSEIRMMRWAKAPAHLINSFHQWRRILQFNDNWNQIIIVFFFAFGMLSQALHQNEMKMPKTRQFIQLTCNRMQKRSPSLFIFPNRNFLWCQQRRRHTPKNN